jgi:hypothetical protein
VFSKKSTKQTLQKSGKQSEWEKQTLSETKKFTETDFFATFFKVVRNACFFA